MCKNIFSQNFTFTLANKKRFMYNLTNYKRIYKMNKAFRNLSLKAKKIQNAENVFLKTIYAI